MILGILKKLCWWTSKSGATKIRTPDFLVAKDELRHRPVGVRDDQPVFPLIYMEAIEAAGASLEEEIVRNMMFEVDKFTGVHFIESDWTELARTRDFLHADGRISSAPDLEDITDPSFGEAANAD